ncbi:MAG: histidine kinase [Rhodococcus sp. (in: high G+C Gram-positive bacteria)]|uniref:sensor histidine kinase n=1 Tax=Rhodococcus sp. TaxID=1831 RepID=UPI002AD7E03B|nr:histidine kinase [Rhodococcus sp. (in: high G+C Gram-positive bacteria)]MDZ7929583.1 histidine kinase [Rhodococcus sp. (in: high G+C Gram-positive bacteria)]
MSRRRNLLPWVRWVPLALVPLLLLASDFPGEYRVPLWYWSAALAAATVSLLGGRWPLPVSLVLSTLAVPMFLTDAWGLSELVPYLGAAGVAEVAMRSTRSAPVVVASVCWTVAVVWGIAAGESSTFWRPATAVETLAFVGLPLLFGLYLRAQRRLAATYRARAADADMRRLEDSARARLAERAALARELHDLVAHHMASIVLRIGVAQHVVAEADPRVRSVLDDVHDTASGALDDIRRLLVALRDPSPGEVVSVEANAVSTEIAEAIERTRATGITVHAEVDTDLGGLDTIARLTLLRVVQESLTNVMKHADAAQPVTVSVVRAGDGVIASIISSLDDSAGAVDAAGHGLIGMAERVALAGGKLEVGVEDGDWSVRATLTTSDAEPGR